MTDEQEMIKALEESIASKDLEIDRLLRLISVATAQAVPEDVSIRMQVLEWAQDVMFYEGEFIAAECLRKLLSTLTHEPESATPKPEKQAATHHPSLEELRKSYEQPDPTDSRGT